MRIGSALSNAARWLFKRDSELPEPLNIAKGIDLMSTFQESGQRQDSLVNQIKQEIATRDASAQAAVDAEARRIALEAELVAEENNRDRLYDELVAYIATLSPLPKVVTDAVEEQKRKADEEARLKAEAEAAEAARVAEEARLAAEAAAAAEAERIAAEQAEAARVAEEQRLADEAAAEAQRLADAEAARVEAERVAADAAEAARVAAEEAARLAAEAAQAAADAAAAEVPAADPAPVDAPEVETEPTPAT